MTTDCRTTREPLYLNTGKNGTTEGNERDVGGNFIFRGKFRLDQTNKPWEDQMGKGNDGVVDFFETAQKCLNCRFPSGALCVGRYGYSVFPFLLSSQRGPPHYFARLHTSPSNHKQGKNPNS